MSDQQQQQKQMSKRDLYTLLIRDIISVGSVGIILLFVHHFAQPFVRGFNCNDETIRYPYKDSTVSSNVCYFTGSAIVIGLVLGVEYLNIKRSNHYNEQQTTPRESAGSGRKLLSIAYATNVYSLLLVWLFGSFANELLTDIAKVTAGRLRPHFIQVCSPLINGSIPIDDYCLMTKQPYGYITNYVCTGPYSYKQLRDIRLSFLSGHSSFSAYSATFAVLYIQKAVDPQRFGLAKPSLQVLIWALAFYTGLTRVSDYKHHWQDVLAGLILGTFMATVMAICLLPRIQKIYKACLDKVSSNRQADGGGAQSAELNRLGY